MIRLAHYLFRPVSASGFGLMRIGWASISLWSVFARWPDLKWYYTDSGVLPSSVLRDSMTTLYKFSLLHWVDSPEGVMMLAGILVLSLLCVVVGHKPRLMVFVSLLLLYSFHNRNGYTLNGGDRMIRIIGFYLLIAPTLKAFSVDRAKERWQSFLAAGNTYSRSSLQMPIWPYRLLLWQFFIIYFLTALSKSVYPVWYDGAAMAIALHHTHFLRIPQATANALAWTYVPLGWFTIVWEFAWVLLLIPRKIYDKIRTGARPCRIGREAVLLEGYRYSCLKRYMLLGGIFLHLGIFCLMDVGIFSPIMLVGYLGLLLDEDFVVFKNYFNRRKHKPIYILFDGYCILCRRSAFILKLLDPLDRIKLADFRDAKNRTKYAKDISEKRLDEEIHIVQGSGNERRIESGFSAFRYLCHHLPTLWILVPVLYLPGMETVGDAVYRQIAKRRMKCVAGMCRHT